MALAVLYDIHGNLPALEAVLGDAEAAGARSYLLGGDYALFGAWPEETVSRLRELDARWIRGNGERWTGSPAEAPEAELVQRAITVSRGRLGPAAVEDLNRLPESAVQDGVRFVHGSPISDVRSFLPDAADDEAELLDGVREPRLVFGHTHLQFTRRAAGGGLELLNPGSVGMPFDGDPRAAYALLSEHGGIDLRRVAYDHAASAAAVRERLGPWAETVAQRIERAGSDD
jgi:diadenosine tetraphosphatase ApaH/serine/threonine PP2A family protein phosphatase